MNPPSLNFFYLLWHSFYYLALVSSGRRLRTIFKPITRRRQSNEPVRTRIKYMWPVPSVAKKCKRETNWLPFQYTFLSLLTVLIGWQIVEDNILIQRVLNRNLPSTFYPSSLLGRRVIPYFVIVLLFLCVFFVSVVLCFLPTTRGLAKFISRDNSKHSISVIS